MDNEDPMVTFFGSEDVDLYAVLDLTNSASTEDIKKSYRRLALRYHPDKHASSSEEEKTEVSAKFQQVGFAYAVLSDSERRSRYDKTGRTDKGVECGDDGWEAYFEDLYDMVTRDTLDKMKEEYQGSEEEVEDLKAAYIETDGSIEEILNHIPHSTHLDESRFVIILSKLITDGTLSKLPKWEASLKDEKAKLSRKKRGEKEAQEAEALAKELGVWDEFFGSGATGKRRAKGGKKKEKEKEGNGEDDVSALQALILKKQNQRSQGSFLDGLAEKYGGKSSGGKRQREEPDITDEEFQRIQGQMLSGPSAKKKAKTKK